MLTKSHHYGLFPSLSHTIHNCCVRDVRKERQNGMPIAFPVFGLSSSPLKPDNATSWDSIFHIPQYIQTLSKKKYFLLSNSAYLNKCLLV